MTTRAQHAARPGRESLSKRLGKTADRIKARVTALDEIRSHADVALLRDIAAPLLWAVWLLEDGVPVDILGLAKHARSLSTRRSRP